ncbi:MAG: helix-turn-helix domain-containing protein [Chryseobacterium sp.]|uniref:helix-turn-helix domain-containing protein n=1 Tax=Chryseobacterium sp. TaxID=1871047 RepID=UPI0025B916E9|nr:helix-turn-helix transcriptional regulator [Chryseobacterium sp.]MCJ7934920.1 helix-turn-helix domain-containing protein [Chryseobacterium sp.]
MIQEKLRKLRKEKGISQESMAKMLFMDTSNYSRKERGEVKIHEDEWKKISEVLDVSTDEIREDKGASIHNENFNFHDNSGNNVNYYNVPEVMMKNTQDYIELLKEQIVLLKEENEKLKSQK